MKSQIIRECKFALCHYNKTKKSSIYHFSALNLQNIIKIIPTALPPVQHQPAPTPYSDSMDVSPAQSFMQTQTTYEPTPFYGTPNKYRKKAPNSQHEYL